MAYYSDSEAIGKTVSMLFLVIIIEELDTAS